MRSIVIAAAAALFALLALSPAALADTGDPGFTLSATPSPRIGGAIQMTLSVPVPAIALVLGSTGNGPTPTALGTFCLDWPPITALPVGLFPQTTRNIWCPIPCDQTLVGASGYLQFAAFDQQGVIGISNAVQVAIAADTNCITE